MAGTKSELPTQKKKDDAAQKGQSFKSRDLTVGCLMLCSAAFLTSFGSLTELMGLFGQAIASGFQDDIQEYSIRALWLALKIILPIILVCVVASALPTLLQTRFVLAGKAIKFSFDALNPVNGFKKLFSLRSVKEAVKALLYLATFAIAAVIFWDKKKALLLAQLHARPVELIGIWQDLLMSLVVTCLACVLIVILLDALAEYFLTVKDMKMDKEEVKREHKEQNGSPEVKGRRRELHMELLSEQLKSDVENSRMIVVNPTHIAIGIFFKPEVVPIPFISVMETNQRALAVRTYAEKIGVPVVRDIPLARRMYKKHRRYSFISDEEIGEVLKLLTWLEETELAGMERPAEEPAADAEPGDEGDAAAHDAAPDAHAGPDARNDNGDSGAGRG
jgi:type III secretion YscU/HrpY family protein